MEWEKMKEGYPKNSGLYLVHKDGAIRLRYWNQGAQKFELVDSDENGFDVAPETICSDPTDWYDASDLIDKITARNTAP